MPFMQRQVTGKQHWVRVETTHGTEFVPGELLQVRDSDTATHPLSDFDRERYKKAIWQYTEGEPQLWENIIGYGARLSAPGYMDCTEWCVFDTDEEAEEYLSEMYGDEDEEEEDNV
jgi:hypothetical protein